MGNMKVNAHYRVSQALGPVNQDIMGDEVNELTTEREKRDCPFPLGRVTSIHATDHQRIVCISNENSILMQVLVAMILIYCVG